MPIYEYECDGCKEVFEVRQKMSDPPPARHSCGSEQVHRILSATTFVLKGTGWYKTDYADKDKSPAGDGEAKPKADDKKVAGDGKAATEAKPKSEAKPAPAKASQSGGGQGSTPAT